MITQSIYILHSQTYCLLYIRLQVTLPVKVMKLMGIEAAIITNAAGGLNSEYNVGDLMILKDHIFMPNLSGQSPLVGANDDR